jgi:NAD(P)-dependent dehydrogenase (short-subunit alcohol dehydrogenase family)
MERGALAEEIRHAGGEALILKVDVRNRAQVLELGDQAVQTFGHIDFWVNNAARLMVKPFLDTSEEDWADLFQSNFMGYVWGCQAAAQHMKFRGKGGIVNVSSVVFEQPPSNLCAYVSAKGAITGLSRALAVELGALGITVNTIAPGATETPLNDEAWSEDVRARYRQRIPLSRIGSPEEVAAAIALFAEPGAAYITGETVRVDGGLVLDGSVGHGQTH